MYIGTGMRRTHTRMDGQREGRREGERDGERHRRRHKLMTSWILEYLQKDRGYVLTFGGTEGSMLVRREWFDAVSNGMV